MITMINNNVPNSLMLIKAGRLVHQVAGNKRQTVNSNHRWSSSLSPPSLSPPSSSSSSSSSSSTPISCSDLGPITRRLLTNHPIVSGFHYNQIHNLPCVNHHQYRHSINHNTIVLKNHQLINQLKCLHSNKGCSSLYNLITNRSFCSQTDKVFMPPEEFLQTKETSQDDPNTVKSGIKTINKSTEDVLFEMFEDSNGTVSVNKFFSALSATGLRVTDPRLKEIVSKLNVIWKAKQDAGSFEALSLDRDTFKTVIRENIVLISRALRHHFVIPEFQEFCKQIEDFYWNCKALTGGKVANYIPQLAKYNPDYWGVTLCTIDGQRYAIGDTEIPFTIQSCGKPINYAIALSELGADIVHRYVGQEPSGRMFNELVLDHDNKPHNPMVNAGAIVVCSLLLYMVEPEMRVSEKFDWVCNYFKSMAGDEYLGFSNATFLSEREAADRNYAIGYYMKENKCFPEKANLKEVMDFYFQMCSLEVNCPTVSVIAATLANGGICPITGQRVISSQAVRDVLSLMHSCGMYDYSGQFAFNVGLPAKSGVSGCTMVVVPNVMGMCLWSPPLDNYGNSVRGLEFCRELVKIFNFHHFDNLRHVPHKKDPRRQRFETKGLKIVSLLFSASSGDVSAMRRYYLSGMDMGLSDYDGRTALHLAASEGHLPCVEFLLKVCKVKPQTMDRWGHTPLDEAKRFNHTSVIEFLSKWEGNKLNKETESTQ